MADGGSSCDVGKLATVAKNASSEESVGDFTPESPIRLVSPVFSAFCGLGCFEDQISIYLVAPRTA